jgi:hypothetical protein
LTMTQPHQYPVGRELYLHHKHSVYPGSISSLDNLEIGVSIRGASLELNRQSRKQEDLHGSTRRVPKGTRNSISVAHAGGLQESGGPCPRTDDCRSDQTTLYRSSCRVEMFRGHELRIVSSEDECHEDLCLGVSFCTIMTTDISCDSGIFWPCICRRAQLTMPKAKAKPRPRTMP